MIKIIIFDYDGVVVDSLKNIYAVYKKILKDYNPKPLKTITEFKKLYGYHYGEFLKNMGVNQNNYKKIQESFKQEIFKKEPKLFQGIIDVIKSLDNDYTLALISANYKEEVMQKLQKYNLIKYFSYTTGTDDKIKHPKRKGIKDIIKKYKINKNEVIYIGDRNIDYDIGKEAGLKYVLLVDYGWGYDKEKIPKQKYIIKKPLDILKVIKKIDVKKC